MSEVSFYHLQSQGIDIALPKLLETIVGRGMRCLVRGAEGNEIIQQMDKVLWTYSNKSFLAHGLDGDKAFLTQEKNHPVLLTTNATDNQNGAGVLMALDTPSLNNLDGFDRVCLMFDGRDPEATAAAREKWKELKNSGAKLTYWQQSDSGKWEKKL